jgi:DNA-binding MarR family transcriptional regulator
LELDGLVTREPDPDDGRVSIATVTPAGRSLGLKAARMLNKKVYKPIEIPADLIDKVFEQLQEIRRYLGDIPNGHELDGYSD